MTDTVPDDDHMLVRARASHKWHIKSVAADACYCGNVRGHEIRGSIDLDAIRQGHVIQSDVSTVCERRAPIDLPDREEYP